MLLRHFAIDLPKVFSTSALVQPFDKLDPNLHIFIFPFSFRQFPSFEPGLSKLANMDNPATMQVPSETLLDEKGTKEDQAEHLEPINSSWEDLVIDPDVDKRLTRKFDKHVVPWLFGLWLLAFIDRYG